MSVNQYLRKLHSDVSYVDTVFNETILPIRNGLCSVLEHDLRPYQMKFSDRLIKATLRAVNEEIAIVWSRQIGKTSTTACSVLSLIVFWVSILKSNFFVTKGLN